jgi:integrase/recombinase XerC
MNEHERPIYEVIYMYELMNTQTNATLTETSVTFSADMFDRWVKYIGDRKPKTAETYTKNLRPFVEYITMNGIRHPERQDVVNYQRYLQESGKKPTTIKAYITAVRIFFRWLRDEYKYTDIGKINTASVSMNHKKQPLRPSECTELMNGIDLDTLQGKRDYAMLLLMITTGIRTVTVSLANVGDIRTEYIKDVGDVTVLYYQGKGHTEKDAALRLPDIVTEALQDFTKERGTVSSNDPLFPCISNKNQGGRMATGSISRIVKTHMRSVGIDDELKTAHSLRRTAANVAVDNGVDARELQQMLDHKDIRTTYIYINEHNQLTNTTPLKISQALFGR